MDGRDGFLNSLKKGFAMDEYEIRDGSVLSVDGSEAVVRVDREEECGGCSSCAVKALCRGRDVGHLDVPVPLSGGARPAVGDRVRIAYHGSNPAVAAAIMFLPPLVGLFLGGYLANHFRSGSDGYLLLGCLLGIVAGLAGTFLLSRLVRGMRPEAKLVGTA